MAGINACIVELSMSVWTARKLDKKASREVKDSKSANSDDAARVNKNLMAGLDNLKKITDFSSMVRMELNKQTLPWSDNGQRLVPMLQFYDLKQWLNEKENEFNVLVNEFLRDYPTLISAQAFQLGALFDRNEFPSVHDIAGKFAFRVGYIPLPQAGDFRVDVVAEMKQELQEQYENIYQDRIKQVNQDLWGRLHEILTRMSDRLGYNEDGTKKVFRDSMVTNAVELTDILKRLNVTRDPELERARAHLESMLLGVDAEELRKDGARDEIKEKVDSALNAWF